MAAALPSRIPHRVQTKSVRSRVIPCTVAAAALLSFVVALLPTATAPAAAPDPAGDLRPMLKQYCYECHGPKKHKAKINFEELTADTASLVRGRATLAKAWDQIHAHEMPPDDADAPLKADGRVAMEAAVDRMIRRTDEIAPRDPGRIVLRRLSRVEYRNTIRDLLGVDYQPAGEFPGDEIAYGFDNVGDVLSIPPLLLEKYLTAADKVTEMAMIRPPDPEGHIGHFSYKEIHAVEPTTRVEGNIQFSENGEARLRVDVTETGRHIIRVRAWGDQAGDEPVKMAVRVDDKELKVFDVTATPAKHVAYDVPIDLKPGRIAITIAFINDFYDPNISDPEHRDRNLHVPWIELVGPPPPKPGPTGSQQLIFGDGKLGETRDAAKAIVERIASRAFRRPATVAEVARFMRVYDQAIADKQPFTEAIQAPLQAILISPHFLFRIEQSPPGVTAPHRITDYELATRMSYLIWSSMPDDELFALAKADKLHEPVELQRQVTRMLASPKSAALAGNFAIQWLQLRRLQSVMPDPQAFPTFNDSLRSAMLSEVLMLFHTVVRDDRPITDLIDPGYTFLNEPLAAHYGITGVTGMEMRRVELTDRRRGGILTSAAVLTATSNPTRTSPVKRGKWVLESILGTPPAPPPPNAGELPDTSSPQTKNLSLRQRLELHRSNPQCASCHRRMDPIGFGLENFNPVGAWRDSDGTHSIDSTGSLADGRSFTGPAELKNILLADKRDFARCLAEKLLTYGLGRGIEYYDAPATRQITTELAAHDYRFSTLVLEVVRSYPFQYRRPASTQSSETAP